MPDLSHVLSVSTPGPADSRLVLVAPRHLAGGGDSSLVTDRLHRDGWTDLSEPGRLHRHLQRPDGTIRLLLEPDPDQPWWTVLGTPTGAPVWHAYFDARTPAEILTRFAIALTNPEPPGPTDPFQSLTDAGWAPDRPGQQKRSSADGLTSVGLRSGDGAAAWYAACRIHGVVLWTATFSARTPAHLITAFTTALASPAPAARPSEAIPPLARPYTTVSRAYPAPPPPSLPATTVPSMRHAR